VARADTPFVRRSAVASTRDTVLSFHRSPHPCAGGKDFRRVPAGTIMSSMLVRFLKDLAAALRPMDESECLRLAGELVGRSRHEEAIGMLNRLLRSKPDSVDGLALRAGIMCETGRLEQAAGDLLRAVTLAPTHPLCLYELALVSYLQGDKQLALQYCARARQAQPGHLQACALQAQIHLDGEHYYDVLKRILGYVKPRTYVEIGVAQGNSLGLVGPATRAIGIDPEPLVTEQPAGNVKVFTLTSDAFFARHDLHAELGGLPVDLAFIDGMHHFEYALRDFANLERYCARDSTILIHDCYPLDQETAERDRRHTFWSGDIWRLIVLLKKYRPDLAVHTIGAPPTGLGVVRNLDPGSRFLVEHYDRLRAEFQSLDYSYLEGDKRGKLNVVPSEWGRVSMLLSATRPLEPASG
jgi:tetratricopeptide (TPR) repeat protein